MDEDLHGGVKGTRWLAWATAGLLVLGVASAGAVGAHNRSEDRRIVTAAGESARGVDAASTTEPVVAVTSPTTVAPTTTAPAPSTTTTATATPAPLVAPTAPPTTKAVPKTTTTASTPSTSATTVTTISGHATVTLANDFTAAFTLSINGRSFTLQPGQQVGPLDIALAPNGNDVVELRAVSNPECGIGDAGGYFVAGGRYRMAIVAGPPGTSCAGIGMFQIKTTPI